MSFKFKKEDRLKSRRIIDELFSLGRVIAVYPVKILWLETELPVDLPAQFAVAVPKRKFKHATDRNKIKRQVREVIRLKKHSICDEIEQKGRQLALMVMFTGDREVPYAFLDAKISEGFDRLKKSL